MAFAIRNLSVLAYANGFTLWHYKAGKVRLNQVEKSDFFADAADMLAEGDMMMVRMRQTAAASLPSPPAPPAQQPPPGWPDASRHRAWSRCFSTSRSCRSDPSLVIEYRPSPRCSVRPIAASLARQGPSFRPTGRPAAPLSTRRCSAERQQVSR